MVFLLDVVIINITFIFDLLIFTMSWLYLSGNHEFWFSFTGWKRSSSEYA